MFKLSIFVISNIFQQFTQPGVIEQVSYVMIAIGGFMFIVSFLGYCGALRESQCMLTTVSLMIEIIKSIKYIFYLCQSIL